MHIEISKDAVKGFRVHVVDADRRTVRTFTYPTIEGARRAARAWTVAYDNCPIVDKSGAQPGVIHLLDARAFFRRRTDERCSGTSAG
jgi:hypothetical protein